MHILARLYLCVLAVIRMIIKGPLLAYHVLRLITQQMPHSRRHIINATAGIA
ncbi:hypothetical protein D3C75_1204780 [compost metagenome]